MGGKVRNWNKKEPGQQRVGNQCFQYKESLWRDMKEGLVRTLEGALTLANMCL